MRLPALRLLRAGHRLGCGSGAPAAAGGAAAGGLTAVMCPVPPLLSPSPAPVVARVRLWGPTGRTGVLCRSRRPKSTSHTGDHDYPGPHHPTHRFGPLADPLLPELHPHAHPHEPDHHTHTATTQHPHPHPQAGSGQGISPLPQLTPMPPPPRDITPELMAGPMPGTAGPSFHTHRAYSTTTGGGPGSGLGTGLGSGGSDWSAAGFPSPDNNLPPAGVEGPGGAGGGSAEREAPPGQGGGRQRQRQQQPLADMADDPQVLTGRHMPPGAAITSGPGRAGDQGASGGSSEAEGGEEAVPPLAS
ncbi:hypothetical protein HYH02_014144 [Chlamydomonas schloesseri]|uniref:Uncharacterized protein n=1 Tax=Chlamydomonas schloesseri TaxID=2026947 RepID=A0A835SNZ4_9CHLO|nr:hypothetical protein HYH02_014144 [Chlamydomonas schloesseri]|eukprot:KAG2429106.1 hypothetical protein HYH02_014144 [Chlamydomonas schloesseri]